MHPDHPDIWLAVIVLVIGAAGMLAEILQHRASSKLQQRAD